jgi:hypothetical protein
MCVMTWWALCSSPDLVDLLHGRLVKLTLPGLAKEQGLTLVHFSAQPEPFLKQKYTLNMS